MFLIEKMDSRHAKGKTKTYNTLAHEQIPRVLTVAPQAS